MFTINNIELRNLEEQVQKNKEDIANHYAIDRSLANFGIKIVGTISTPEELPDPLTYQGEYGDGYAVGQPGAYDYYIFTRPDLNSGHPDNYWLNVGSISIVGPEGPQGPIGPQGPVGQSNKWFTGEYLPESGANVGDMYLSNSGQVFQYKEGGQWVPISNIIGPQGIQGIQGIQGPQGIQGIQGEKGPRGDVGGFINIWGILGSTDQLPTPESLQNLTVAYLIAHTGGSDQANDHYDLYIQIGRNSEEATWSNVGPFNAATLVTVGGEGQNVWNADTKLDKITTSGSRRLYGVKRSDGAQEMVQIVDNMFLGNIINMIPQYFDKTSTQKYGSTLADTKGVLLTNEPNQPYQCANKKYVDSKTGLYYHELSLLGPNNSKIQFTFMSRRSTEYATISDLETIQIAQGRGCFPAINEAKRPITIFGYSPYMIDYYDASGTQNSMPVSGVEYDNVYPVA